MRYHYVLDKKYLWEGFKDGAEYPGYGRLFDGLGNEITERVVAFDTVSGEVWYHDSITEGSKTRYLYHNGGMVVRVIFCARPLRFEFAYNPPTPKPIEPAELGDRFIAVTEKVDES